MAIFNTEKIMMIHPKDDFGDIFNPKFYHGYFVQPCVIKQIIKCDVSSTATTIGVKHEN